MVYKQCKINWKIKTLERWHCGASGNNMVKDSKGQRKLEESGGRLLPAVEVCVNSVCLYECVCVHGWVQVFFFVLFCFVVVLFFCCCFFLGGGGVIALFIHLFIHSVVYSFIWRSKGRSTRVCDTDFHCLRSVWTDDPFIFPFFFFFCVCVRKNTFEGDLQTRKGNGKTWGLFAGY